MQGWLKSRDSKEYFELLKFQTVGTDPARRRDCVQAATWLKKWLESIGAKAELVLPANTSGLEKVVREYLESVTLRQLIEQARD